MRRNYSQPSGSASYQQRYAGFRGVDFANSPNYVDVTRSPYAENIIVDSKGVPHKRKGVTPTNYDLQTEEGIVRGAPFAAVQCMSVFKPSKQEPFMVIHAGNDLYTRTLTGQTFWHVTGWDSARWGYMNFAPSTMFQHKDRLYIMDGKNFYVYWYSEEDGQWCLEPVYMSATPTETQVAGYYLAEEVSSIDDQQQSQVSFDYTWQFGEKGERNLLTQRRYNTFCGDGEHKTFYLDGQNLKVLKVELYSPTSAAPSSGGEGTFTNGSSRSNVRDKPSQTNGAIIGHASAHQAFPVLGKTGKWYKIQYSSTVVGYIHESRGTYTQPSGGDTPLSPTETEWVTLTETTDYTVAEVGASGEEAGNTGVKVYNCTKITFTNKPNPHPRGNGLPNIRVLCVPVETATLDITAEDLDDNREYVITAPRLFVGDLVVKMGDQTVSTSDYSVTYATYHDHRIAYITFNQGVVGESDTVTLYYTREETDGLDTVSSCDKYGKFGEYNFDRWFFTGNTSYINRDWYSEPDDPTCVLENSFTDIGDAATPIAGYLNLQSDMLLIKEETPHEALFRRTVSNDGDLTIFPVKSYQGDGALSRYALTNIKGKCLYLTRKGLFEFASSDLGTKYGTQDRSFLVNDRMLQEENFNEARLHQYNDLIIISFPNGHCYVADTNQQTAPTLNGGYGFEWFYWTNLPMSHAVEFGGKYYFTTPGADGDILEEVRDDLYSDSYYPDVEFPITALWTTPLDELSDPARYKFLNRRGAMLQFDQKTPQTLELAVVLDGERPLLFRDEDMERDWLTHCDFTLIDLNAATSIPYVTLNTPSGRFKYLQFIFRNSDPGTDGIAILSIEFQYRFGRYII